MSLGVSERHSWRMLAAYRKEGAAALPTGTDPPTPIPDAGANHTHFTELLRDREGIDLSRPTVRCILTKAGIGSPSSRRARRNTVSAARGCPRRGCWWNWTAAITPGWRTEGPNSPCCWPWTTPPALWPTPCSHRRGHPGLLHADGGLSSAGALPWPCTAIAMPSSSTTPVSRRRRRNPPSSPMACRNCGSGQPD